MSEERIVIVGAGQAAGQCAASLRRNGFEGEIVMVGDEPHPPYQRPPLSKAYLSGEIEQDRLWVQPPEVWQEQKVELRLGVRADVIDRDAKTIALSDGSSLSYSTLVLATGSRVRPLPAPGAELEGVRYLRTIADIDVLKRDVAPGKRIAIIGGGYIGLEAASVAKKLGAEPIVIEAMPRCLARVAVPELSEFFENAHRRRGVDVRSDALVAELLGETEVEAVLLKDGGKIEVDSALIGIGILPNQELAEAAGIAVSNGIEVDAHCRTSDPDIYAIGDCAAQVNWLTGSRLRLESVPNALEQAKHAAAAITGSKTPPNEVPWFWSDQFDLKLQTAGLFQGADELIIRRTGEEQVSFFHLKAGVLIAADCVNDPQSFMASKMMIGKRGRPDPQKLADTQAPMKEIMKAAIAAS